MDVLRGNRRYSDVLHNVFCNLSRSGFRRCNFDRAFSLMTAASIFQHRSQPIAKFREPQRTYDAVLALRRMGFRIYRAGGHLHLFNGSLRTGAELVEIASMFGEMGC